MVIVLPPSVVAHGGMRLVIDGPVAVMVNAGPMLATFPAALSTLSGTAPGAASGTQT